MLNKSSSAPIATSSAREEARPRRCDSDFPYEDILFEKFSPAPDLQIIYGNGHTVNVAVREVLDSGALIVYDSSSILNFEHVRTVRSLNSKGFQIVEDIYLKLKKVFDVCRVENDFIADGFHNSISSAQGWQEKVVKKIQKEVMIGLRGKLAEQMNDNVSQGEVKKPEKVPVKQDVVAA